MVRAEAELLEAHGHDVVTWSPANPAAPTRQLVTLALAPWNPVSARRARERTASTLPDVAHVHNTWYSLSPSVFPAVKRLGVPVVMTVHNFRLVCANAQLQRDERPCELCVGTVPWHGVRYRCYRGSYAASFVAATTIALNRRLATWSNNVDRFLVLTEFARAKLVAGGLPEDRVVVKPNFVEDPGSRPTAPSASDFVLFAGRLTTEKGILGLLAAWELGSPPFRLLIAGDGPLRDRIAARVPDGVELLGWVDGAELRRLMLSARALMFPSEWYEGMPMTLIEAFACGLPVLASRLGSMIEMVEPLGERWLVEPGNPRRWAEAMSALADGHEVDDAGRRARAVYTAVHSREHALRNLIDAYTF